MEAYRVVPDAPVLNVMLYGDAGTGKTSLAGSAQDHEMMQNVLFANIEGGLLSISHRGDIHAVDCKETKQVQELFWALAKGEEFQTVQTVVLDSVTELQTVNLEEIVAEAVHANRSSRSGKARTMDDIWQEDYGKSTTQLKRLIRGFKDLPKNFICTALAKRNYPKVPEGTDMTRIDPLAVVPSLTAKLGESVMGYMDMVWYTYIHISEGGEEDAAIGLNEGDLEHRLLTQKSGPYFAKTRGIRFAEEIGPMIRNPNFTEIYDLLVKSQTSDKKAIKKSTAGKK